MTTKQIVKNLLDNAKADYLIRQLPEILKLFDDPGYIKDKDMALTVCNAMIQICIEKGGMASGSIMHRLGLRLMDYINHEK